MHELKKEILVIDDEPEVRDMLREFLEENGFSVTLASDGITARESLDKKLPAIIIVDLLLPGEHGLNLVKDIKEKYFLPVIIISSIYNRGEIEDFMEEHYVEGFYEKPIDLVKMLEQLNTIMKNPQ